MIKRFCDICGRELSAATDMRPIEISLALPRLKVVQVCSNGTALLEADICKYCIIDALTAQDDR